MKRFDSINMIPFIDIMLVLLAIVLTTATFISQGQLDIDLPDAGIAEERQNSPLVDIAIDRNKQVYCNSEPILPKQLASCLDPLQPLGDITLRVDEEVPFKRFVQVAEKLKTYDPQSLVIVTERAQ